MPADNLWARQFVEGMMEVSRLFSIFKDAPQPNVEDLDKAWTLYEEYCDAYELENITFEELTGFGESLRARQARKVIQKDYEHE